MKSQSTFAHRIVLAFILLAAVLDPGALSQQRNRNQSAEYPARLMAELLQLRDAALKSSYAYEKLAHLCNNIGPRLSGSPQAQQAVRYVADEMRRIGLDVRLEKVMAPHWVRGVETGELVKFAGQAPGTTQKIVLTALGGSTATNAEGLTAEVIVVDSFDDLHALGRERVAGKIVLFNARFDKQMAAQGFALDAYGQAVVYRGAGPSEAARLGASAALVRSVGGADYRLPHTGAFGYAEDAPKIPAAAVAAEDADLIAYLTAQGQVRMHLTLTPRRCLMLRATTWLPISKAPSIPNKSSSFPDIWIRGTLEPEPSMTALEWRLRCKRFS
jgi:carboxypeptidase Q